MKRKGRPTNDDDAELWRVNPSDVRRHARRMRERERVGPLGTIVRYALVAAVLAAIVFGYRNFDTVRAFAADLVARTGSAPGGSVTDGRTSPAGDEPETVVVESGQIAGTPLPSAVGGAPPTPDDAAADSPPVAVPPAVEEPVVAAAEPLAAPEPVVAPEPVAIPEPPPGPETFELGSAVVTVSEAAASAAVLVLRGGDRRRVSTVVWSTREGTAKAGSDYIDRGAIVERFAAGEQNRTIRVPIVGDRNPEGVENFYVILAPDDGAAGQRREAQVVINDDD